MISLKVHCDNTEFVSAIALLYSEVVQRPLIQEVFTQTDFSDIEGGSNKSNIISVLLIVCLQ